MLTGIKLMDGTLVIVPHNGKQEVTRQLASLRTLCGALIVLARRFVRDLTLASFGGAFNSATSTSTGS